MITLSAATLVGSLRPCGRTRCIEKLSSKLGSKSTNSSNREIAYSVCSDDFDQFIKFVNMLMSDTTFHLEESLTSLAKINSIQSQKADEKAWARLEKTEQDDLDAQIRQAESQAPYHTVMGLDHVELIKAITATAKEPFVTSEIVDRLAAVSEWLYGLTGLSASDAGREPGEPCWTEDAGASRTGSR